MKSAIAMREQNHFRSCIDAGDNGGADGCYVGQEVIQAPTLGRETGAAL